MKVLSVAEFQLQDGDVDAFLAPYFGMGNKLASPLVFTDFSWFYYDGNYRFASAQWTGYYFLFFLCDVLMGLGFNAR